MDHDDVCCPDVVVCDLQLTPVSTFWLNGSFQSSRLCETREPPKMRVRMQNRYSRQIRTAAYVRRKYKKQKIFFLAEQGMKTCTLLLQAPLVAATSCYCNGSAVKEKETKTILPWRVSLGTTGTAARGDSNPSQLISFEVCSSCQQVNIDDIPAQWSRHHNNR